MIVKYQNYEKQGFIDNVAEVERWEVKLEDCISEYADIPKLRLSKKQGYDLNLSRENGEPLEEYVRNINMMFAVIGYKLSKISVKHSLSNKINYRSPLTDIRCMVIKPKKTIQFECVAILVNTPAYLLNDEGKTIERL